MSYDTLLDNKNYFFRQNPYNMFQLILIKILFVYRIFKSIRIVLKRSSMILNFKATIDIMIR